MHAVVAYLRRLSLAPGLGEATDGQLLDDFVSRRDQAAFAALIQRHGPLVWGVCRRVLSHTQDAEDAFQATLLILVRRAKSIRKRASVRSWLYGVAYRVAVRAKANRHRREVCERQAPGRPDADHVREVALHDLRSVLDEEINRLPAAERLAVILCYLEGRTNDEAAHLLGWPRGTIATRLARARERLGSRLARRGLSLSGSLFSIAGPPAAPPAALAIATVKAALLVASGSIPATGVITPTVISLTEGVLQTMFLTKLKMGATLVVAVGLLSGSAAIFAYPRPGAQSAVQEKEQRRTQEPLQQANDEKIQTLQVPMLGEEKVKTLLATAPGGEKMKSLLKARLEAAQTEMIARMKQHLAGRGTLDFLLDTSQRLRKAELELCIQKSDRLLVLENQVQIMKKIVELNQERFNAGRITVDDLKVAEFYLLDAEIDLERAKAQ
jgi:RNA polymerase sigma factor (sigma-70 family)